MNMHRRRTVAGLVMLLVTGPAEAQQALSPAQLDRVRTEVVAHIDKYYRVFSERQPQVLAREVFNSPWIVIGGSGPQADLTVEQAQERFQASMNQLVGNGWARSAFTTETVCVINATAAIASGYNTRYKTDGSVMSVGGVTYILGKGPEGWRIVSYSGHPRGRNVRCD